MKILTPGINWNKANPLVFTCRVCSCRFSVEEKEATLVPDQRDGDYYEVKCPETFCRKTCTMAVSVRKRT